MAGVLCLDIYITRSCGENKVRAAAIEFYI